MEHRLLEPQISQVQRASDLLLSTKASVDQDRRPERFIPTGRANALTRPRVANSLAGRMSLHQLWPLSQGQLEGTEGNIVDALFVDGLRTAPVTGDLEERVLRGAALRT